MQVKEFLPIYYKNQRSAETPQTEQMLIQTEFPYLQCLTDRPRFSLQSFILGILPWEIRDSTPNSSGLRKLEYKVEFPPQHLVFIERLGEQAYSGSYVAFHMQDAMDWLNEAEKLPQNQQFCAEIQRRKQEICERARKQFVPAHFD